METLESLRKSLGSVNLASIIIASILGLIFTALFKRVGRFIGRLQARVSEWHTNRKIKSSKDYALNVSELIRSRAMRELYRIEISEGNKFVAIGSFSLASFAFVFFAASAQSASGHLGALFVKHFFKYFILVCGPLIFPVIMFFYFNTSLKELKLRSAYRKMAELELKKTIWKEPIPLLTKDMIVEHGDEEPLPESK